jgi:hypothetical protein
VIVESPYTTAFRWLDYKDAKTDDFETRHEVKPKYGIRSIKKSTLSKLELPRMQFAFGIESEQFTKIVLGLYERFSGLFNLK